MNTMDWKDNYIRKSPGRGNKITENTPLTTREDKFLNFLIDEGTPGKAYTKLCEWELEEGLREQMPTDSTCSSGGANMLQRPNVQKEYWIRLEQMRQRGVADSTEVMQYFTSVMRGQIKDQFGLDASLSDRTQAARELAKRTVDVENRVAGKPDAVIAISLDWSRSNEEE